MVYLVLTPMFYGVYSSYTRATEELHKLYKSVPWPIMCDIEEDCIHSVEIDDGIQEIFDRELRERLVHHDTTRETRQIQK